MDKILSLQTSVFIKAKLKQKSQKYKYHNSVKYVTYVKQLSEKSNFFFEFEDSNLDNDFRNAKNKKVTFSQLYTYLMSCNIHHRTFPMYLPKEYSSQVSKRFE